MTIEPEIKPSVDVCVVGAGTCGAPAAMHLASAGCSVVMLEAGKEFDIDTEFSNLPFDSSKLLWPFRRAPFNWYMVEEDNVTPMEDQYGMKVPNRLVSVYSGWGVGGTTLIFGGGMSRVQYFAVDKWDDEYDYAALPGYDQDDPYSPRWRYELIPYYEFVESFVPIVNMPMGWGQRSTNNAIPLVGAKNILPEFNPEEILDPTLTDLKLGGYEPVGGYRGAPVDMTNECWHCGNCHTGCHFPVNAKLEQKVKRAANVSFVPAAKREGCEVRDRCIALAVLWSENPDLPHMVVYGAYSDPYFTENLRFDKLVLQPAEVVVLSAGVSESPKLWLQSNQLVIDQSGLIDELLHSYWELYHSDENLNSHIPLEEFKSFYVKEDGNGNKYTLPENKYVGQNLTISTDDLVIGIFDQPVDQWVGGVIRSRVDLPEYVGSLWSWGHRLFELDKTGILFTDNRYYTDMVSGEFLDGPDGDEIAFHDSGDLKVDPEQHYVDYDPGPVWKSSPYAPNYVNPMHTFGVDFKEKTLKKYRNMGVIAIHTDGAAHDSERKEYNRLFLHPQYQIEFKVGEETASVPIPVPLLTGQYVPAQASVYRKIQSAIYAMNILKEAGNNSELNLQEIQHANMQFDIAAVAAATMAMGKVVNSDGEAMYVDENSDPVMLDENGNPTQDPEEFFRYQTVDRIYVADSSVFPSLWGGGRSGAEAVFTIGIRTAEAIYNKWFYNPRGWRKWKTKVGTGNFWSF